jgi:hypothetical protein
MEGVLVREHASGALLERNRFISFQPASRIKPQSAFEHALKLKPDSVQVKSGAVARLTRGRLEPPEEDTHVRKPARSNACRFRPVARATARNNR